MPPDPIILSTLTPSSSSTIQSPPSEPSIEQTSSETVNNTPTTLPDTPTTLSKNRSDLTKKGRARTEEKGKYYKPKIKAANKKVKTKTPPVVIAQVNDDIITEDITETEMEENENVNLRRSSRPVKRKYFNPKLFIDVDSSSSSSSSKSGSSDDEEEVDASNVCCICKKSKPPGLKSKLVDCDNCKGWFHTICEGLKEDMNDTDYICTLCSI